MPRLRFWSTFGAWLFVAVPLSLLLQIHVQSLSFCQHHQLQSMVRSSLPQLLQRTPQYRNRDFQNRLQTCRVTDRLSLTSLSLASSRQSQKAAVADDDSLNHVVVVVVEENDSVLFATADGVLSNKDDRQLQEWNKLHNLLCALQRQIPNLLTVPLTAESANRTYTSDIRVLLGGSSSSSSDNEDDDEDAAPSELVSSCDELIRLMQVLVFAVSASTRAGNFLSPPTSTFTNPPTSRMPIIQCRLGYSLPKTKNQTITMIQAEWQVDLAPLLATSSSSGSSSSSSGAKTSSQVLKGRSLLFVDRDTGKISVHRLMKVKWNEQEQDATSIGRFLASSRQAVRTLRESPWLQPFSPLLEQAGNEWIQQQQQQQRLRDADDSTLDYNKAVPLFVIQSTIATEKGNRTVDKDQKSQPRNATRELWIPLDEYSPNNTTTSPLPGSVEWPEFYAMYQSIQAFCRDMIPALSSGDVDSADASSSLSNYFQPNARLYTTDGSLLLQGAHRLANFYNRLASWRRRSFATWAVEKVQVLPWKSSSSLSSSSKTDRYREPRIKVTYNTSIPIPGRATPISAHGSDIYTLVVKKQEVETSRPFPVTIAQVEQLTFFIGTEEQAYRQDGVWWMRSLATAVETERATDDDNFVLTELMQRISQRASSNKKSQPSPARDVSYQFPKRSDAAALVVYRIMEALHSESRQLVDPASSLLTPPASSFMTNQVKLSGYLGETLIRGQSAYNRNIGLAMASLRSGIQSGGILLAKDKNGPVRARIELTDQGNVLFALNLRFKLAPMAGFPGMKDLNTNAGLIPLELTLVSEYILDQETGKIQQHRLIETRINDQLTPGDVVSRWIRRFSDGSTPSPGMSGGTDGLSDTWLRTIRETVNWFQSLNRGDF